MKLEVKCSIKAFSFSEKTSKLYYEYALLAYVYTLAFQLRYISIRYFEIYCLTLQIFLNAQSRYCLCEKMSSCLREKAFFFIKLLHLNTIQFFIPLKIYRRSKCKNSDFDITYAGKMKGHWHITTSWMKMNFITLLYIVKK